MALSAGTRLGPFEILAPLGAGGMGEVYRARDTKLGREVALKVLPEDFAGNEDRLARFEREARVLASLNHPHIATLHGFEQEAETRFLVMELVGGEDLATRLQRGPLRVREALPLFLQVAEGLEAAHEHGIIHRDLKPANIKLTEDGTVKVLDFGLAKAVEPDPAGDSSRSPTLTAAATRNGAIMGTAAYMSPEQAVGRHVDKRSDIWSFGVVLFEALTGKRLFDGETVSHVLAAVLRAEPDWHALPSDMPEAIRRLLRRCLQRDVKERLRDIGDARVEIKEAMASPAGGELTGHTIAARRRTWRWALGAAAVGALLTLSATWLLRPAVAPSPREVTHFTIPVPGGHDMCGFWSPRLAVSPDGRTVVYVADRQVHVRALSDEASVVLAGTEDAESPFFSPDGRWIGFAQDGVLKKVTVEGGPVLEIPGAKVGDFVEWASWAEDGTIGFRGAAGPRFLRGIAVAGGIPAPLTTLHHGDLWHLWPQALNAGRQMLYTVLGPGCLWDDAKIVLEDLETGARTTVVEQGTSGRYVSTGHVVYATATGTIMALPWDLARRRRTGSPFPVEAGVRVGTFGGPVSFVVSDGGTAVFVRGDTRARRLVWRVDRQGHLLGQIGSSLAGGIAVELSPDGRRIATNSPEGSSHDIWLVDVGTGERDRFTFDTASDWTPVWAPDGRRLAFMDYAGEGARATVRIASVDDRGHVEAVYTADTATDLWVDDWSPDGKWLVFHDAPEGHEDLHAIRVDAPGSPMAIATTSANERAAQFSPDGGWLAYASDEGGREEVYVVSFPDLSRRLQVSSTGGRMPRWSSPGDELYFWTLPPDSTLMASRVSIASSLTREPPHPLFKAADLGVNMEWYGYDVSPDGQSFFLSVMNPEARAREIHVVVNWLERLKHAAPGE